MKLTTKNIFRPRMLFSAVIGVLGIIGAQRQQAWANDIAYRDTVYRTDFATAGVGGLRNTGRGTIVLTGVTGTVSQAWLYWAGPMNVTDPLANANISVNGQPITGVNIGFSDDNCWGYKNSAAYRADVTALVKKNGSYTLTGLLHQGTNVNANGASLLVFYNDGIPSNDRDIVYFDGNDSNAANPYDAMGWNVSLQDIRYKTGKGSIQLHASDGQIYPDKTIYLNGRVLAGEGAIFQGKTVRSDNNGPINNGNLWDIRSWDVTPYLASGTNGLTMRHENVIGSDCIALIVAVINLPVGAAPPPLNHAPVVMVEPEITVNTPHPMTLEALATDEDGDALTGMISVDGLMLRTNIIAAAGPVTTGTLRLTNGFALGEHVVTFIADDGKEQGHGVTILRVIDNTPPVLNLPPNFVVPTDPGKNTAVVNYIVTATDDFPGVSVVSTPASGFAFPIGVTTVNATAVDGSGNMTRGSFTVTVIDSIPPVINCPSNTVRIAERGTNGARVLYTASATDNLPGLTVNCAPPSGSFFPLGDTSVNCIARDVAGNTASCQFLVTIVDGEPPVILVPTNMIVANDLGQCAALVNYVVTVRDNLPGTVLVCAPASGSVFPAGLTRVLCNATDASGNRSSNSFSVTVEDREKPVLNLPADIIAGCNAGPISYAVTATDNCSTARVTCTPASGSVFARGTNTVRCTATDAEGNTATGSFKVILLDNQPPIITSVKSSKSVLWPPNHKMVPITVTVVATDACGGPVTNRIASITSNQPLNGTGDGSTAADSKITGNLGALLLADLVAERSGNGGDRVYTITVESKDAAGNVSTGTTTVTVPHSSPN